MGRGEPPALLHHLGLAGSCVQHSVLNVTSRAGAGSRGWQATLREEIGAGDLTALERPDREPISGELDAKSRTAFSSAVKNAGLSVSCDVPARVARTNRWTSGEACGYNPSSSTGRVPTPSAVARRAPDHLYHAAPSGWRAGAGCRHRAERFSAAAPRRRAGSQTRTSPVPSQSSPAVYRKRSRPRIRRRRPIRRASPRRRSVPFSTARYAALIFCLTGDT